MPVKNPTWIGACKRAIHWREFPMEDANLSHLLQGISWAWPHTALVFSHFQDANEQLKLIPELQDTVGGEDAPASFQQMRGNQRKSVGVSEYSLLKFKMNYLDLKLLHDWMPAV